MTAWINTKMCFRFASAGSSSSAETHQESLRMRGRSQMLESCRSVVRTSLAFAARPTHNHRFGIWCGKMNLVLLHLRNSFISMWWIWIVWFVMTGNGLQERTHQDICWYTGVKIRCNTFVRFSSLQCRQIMFPILYAPNSSFWCFWHLHLFIHVLYTLFHHHCSDNQSIKVV